MSGVNPTFPEWLQTEWDDGIIHLYQDNGGRVANTIRKKVVTDAKDMIFRTIGKIDVHKIAAGGGKRPRSGAKRQKITLTPEEVGVMLEVHEFDLERLSPDDRDHQMMEAYKAFARDTDDCVIEAMAAESTDSGIGGSTSADFMSPVMVSYMWETLNAQGIYKGETEVYCLISPRAESQLERFKEFTSADYTGADLPFEMSGRTWKNVHWITHDRLPATGDVRQCFFYTPESYGLGVLQELRTIWSWENDEDLWLGNLKTSRAAKRLIENGGFYLSVNEAITPESIDPDNYTSGA